VTGCEKLAVYRIIFANDANYPVSIYGDYIFPDTSISSSKPEFINLDAHSVRDVFDDDIKDEKFKRLKTEKLTIFVFHSDTLKKYDWTAIRSGYKILRRYEVNDSILRKSEYVLVYP
jgi:hypothetical protein